MLPFDELYPQENSQSAAQQLLAQLANPLPGDLGHEGTREFRGLAKDLREWNAVRNRCKSVAGALFDGLAGLKGSGKEDSRLPESSSPDDPSGRLRT